MSTEKEVGPGIAEIDRIQLLTEAQRIFTLLSPPHKDHATSVIEEILRTDAWYLNDHPEIQENLNWVGYLQHQEDTYEESEKMRLALLGRAKFYEFVADLCQDNAWYQDSFLLQNTAQKLVQLAKLID